MQRTSSCGQLDALRKTSSAVDAPGRTNDGLAAAIAELNAQLPQRACLQAPPSVGGLSVLRKTVIPEGEVRLEQLSKMAIDFQIREKNLDLGPDFDLFDWPSVILPAPALHEFPMLQLPLPKPLGSAKQVLADLYQKKYGVVIHCKFNGRDAQGVLDGLIEKVRRADRQAVGFVVPLRLPEGWPNAESYRGHVLPLVIQESSAGFDVINLDSLAGNSDSFRKFLELFQERMASTGVGVLRSCLVSSRRQSDKHSCHTDALQVLKDTLCALKQRKNGCAYDLFMESAVSKPTGNEVPRFVLPSFLQKTTQRKRVLTEDKFDGASPLQPSRMNLLFTRKSVFVGQHRYKYLAMLGVKERNNFLTIKAYYNAQKVLTHLEGLSDPAARRAYLTHL